MTGTLLVGLALGLGFGASLLLLVASLAGWRPPPAAQRAEQPTLRVPGTRRAALTARLTGPDAMRRAWTAVAAGLLVAVLTRWPVAVGATVALIYLWPTMFGGAKHAAGQVERLEALATWTESLRDSIAGAIGLEDAIRHSLTSAPPALQPALQRLEGRVRVQIPLPHALAAYAEEFQDSSADLVVASLILNSRLRGPGLVATLSALAASAREELAMRRRIEEGRKSLRRSATIIVGVTAVFAGGLAVLSRSYVAPYGTAVGQMVLALVLAVFAVGLIWIRAAADVKAPDRFLVGADQIDQIHSTAGHFIAGHGTAGPSTAGGRR